MLGIPDKALESHIAILGKTGSGKSNTAKVVAERIMSAGGRVCVIDPTGTWWGVRLRADGKKPSKFAPVIFGGLHADIPIAGEHGAAIAKAVATSSTSAIIDTRTMKVGERTKFFTDFAEALLRANQGTLHMIIDEAHLFAPQGGAKTGGMAPAMLHAANNLVSLGRGLGLRIILISQRPAKLHKDSLTQVETLVAMRLIAPQDRRAIEDWIGEWADAAKGKEIVTSLASLATGVAWVWAPEIGVLDQVHFPLAATFDSGKPLAGTDAPALGPIDVDTVTRQLEQIRADVVANDPVRLKRRVAELERQLATQSATPAPEIIAAAEDRGEDRGYRRGLDEGITRGRLAGIAVGITRAQTALNALRVDDGENGVPVTVHAHDESYEARVRLNSLPVSTASGAKPTRATRPEKPVDMSTTAGALTPAKRKILVALRELEAIGQMAPDKQTVAWFSDASPKSSAFANNLGALRSAGLIDYPGQGVVSLTDAGRIEQPARGAPTHETIMELVRGKLTPALIRMLEVTVRAYPEDISVLDLASEAGASATSSAFANNRGRLRSLGLIEYPSTGWVRAADLLFPTGAQ